MGLLVLLEIHSRDCSSQILVVWASSIFQIAKMKNLAHFTYWVKFRVACEKGLKICTLDHAAQENDVLKF